MESPWLQSSWYSSTTSSPTALAPQAQPGKYGYQPDWPKSRPRSFIYEYNVFRYANRIQRSVSSCQLQLYVSKRAWLRKTNLEQDLRMTNPHSLSRIQEKPCQIRPNHAIFYTSHWVSLAVSIGPWGMQLVIGGAASQRASKIKLVNCNKGVLRHLATKKVHDMGFRCRFRHRFTLHSVLQHVSTKTKIHNRCTIFCAHACIISLRSLQFSSKCQVWSSSVSQSTFLPCLFGTTTTNDKANPASVKITSKYPHPQKKTPALCELELIVMQTSLPMLRRINLHHHSPSLPISRHGVLNSAAAAEARGCNNGGPRHQLLASKERNSAEAK